MLVLAKVLVSPLLLAAATFAVHRWGTLAGGLLLGLPLVSGPISVLLFAQYGSRFAVHAAYGTMLGFVAAGAFCSSYAAVSSKRSWWQALTVAYVAFFVTAAVLSLVHVDFAWLAVLVLVALTSLAFTIDAPADPQSVAAPRKRILALRMAIAGATVLLITAAARYLGAEVAGFLAPLPVLAAIMATASHRDSGSDAVHGLLRGTVFGLWGGAAFFSVVILLVGTVGPLVTYVAAFVSAVLAGSIAVMVQAAVRRVSSTSWHVHAPAWGRAMVHAR